MSTFFDTNVLVYAFEDGEPRKQLVARECLREHLSQGSFTISTQVLQEFFSVVRRKKLLTPEAALAAAEQLCDSEVRTTTADGVLRALALCTRHQLSVWDALIVQAALDARCTTLLTEDLQPGMRFGTLQVVNPFELAAHEPPAAYAAKAPRRKR